MSSQLIVRNEDPSLKPAQAFIAACNEKIEEYNDRALKFNMFTSSLAQEIQCQLCKHILEYPKTLLCCGASFCSRCILAYRKEALGLVTSSGEYLPEPAIETLSDPDGRRAGCPSCCDIIISPPVSSHRLDSITMAYRKLARLPEPEPVVYSWPEPHALMISIMNERYTKMYQAILKRQEAQLVAKAKEGDKPMVKAEEGDESVVKADEGGVSATDLN
ncbi:hypothetical protein PQX77_002433 [Marasmius sp. AFHP31]|nr:hypothetical protein PQX77_002433 [Marasmius sp. AFHP31]